MTANHSDDYIRKKAQKRVNEKKGVFIHLTASLATAILLVALSVIIGSPVEMWLLFPILPLILAFFIHYVVIFGFPGTNIMTEDWEQDQLDYEMWKLHLKRRQEAINAPDQGELELKELDKRHRKPDESELV